MAEIDLNQRADELLDLAYEIATEALGAHCPVCKGDGEIECFQSGTRADGEQASYMGRCKLCGGDGFFDYVNDTEWYVATIIGLLYALSLAPERPKRPAPSIMDDLRNGTTHAIEAALQLANARHAANIDDAVDDGSLTPAQATRQLTEAVGDKS